MAARIRLSAWIVLIGSALVMADPPAKTPEKVDSPKTDSVNSAPLSSGDKEVDDLLDKLEAKGDVIRGLTCKLRYNYITFEPVKSSEIKTGELLYAKPTGTDVNSRFKIQFTAKVDNGVVTRHEEQIAFDGQWLIERNDKAKTIIWHEVVRKGEIANPFELGKGPFPMPFGQKRDDMLRHFKIKREKSVSDEPPGTVHLTCIPHSHSSLAPRYKRVDLLIDIKSYLPIKITSERIADDNRIEATFTDIDTKAAPGLEKFKVEEPKDFDKRIEPRTDKPSGPNDMAPLP